MLCEGRRGEAIVKRSYREWTHKLPLTVVIAIAFLLSAVVPAAATESVRIPRSEAEWNAMNPAEQARVHSWLWDRFQSDLESGEAVIHETSSTSAGSSDAGTAAAAAVSVTYQCVVQWTTYPGSGDYVRGGGWTDASAIVDNMSAGIKTNSQWGQFLRDGAWVANWGLSGPNRDRAEAYTGWHWTWWWETSNWTTRGWHWAYDNGVWLLGPDRYCTVSKLL